MLSFKALEGEVGVWVYHVRDNRWERLPAVHPCPGHATIADAAYDERHNAVVISGSSAFGYSAALTNRETWTYRYRPVEKAAPALGAAQHVACETAEDGRVIVSWVPAGGPAVSRYRIERGAGDEPWLVRWEQAGEVDGATTTFTDAPGEKALTFYRVIAVGPDGLAGGAVARPGEHRSR